MAERGQIFDGDGNMIGDIPLSESAQGKLREDGDNIVILYHTPQMLRGVLGTRSGSFTLRRVGARFVSDNPVAVREYANIQRVRLRGPADDPE